MTLTLEQELELGRLALDIAGLSEAELRVNFLRLYHHSCVYSNDLIARSKARERLLWTALRWEVMSRTPPLSEIFPDWAQMEEVAHAQAE